MSTIDQNDALYWKWLLGPFKYVICIHISELFAIFVHPPMSTMTNYFACQKKRLYFMCTSFIFSVRMMLDHS